MRTGHRVGSHVGNSSAKLLGFEYKRADLESAPGPFLDSLVDRNFKGAVSRERREARWVAGVSTGQIAGNCQPNDGPWEGSGGAVTARGQDLALAPLLYLHRGEPQPSLSLPRRHGQGSKPTTSMPYASIPD